MEKPAPVNHPIHELLSQRFSPRAFLSEPLPDGCLDALLEAARWAPSCFNEQPWHFVVAERANEPAFERLLGCLNETNRSWAKNASALLLSVAKTRFSRNDRPNAHAWHDVGMAVMSLTIEATARGLGVHQMAGFDREQARTEAALPEGYEPVAFIAVGKTGEPDLLPDQLAEREKAPRTRKPASEFVSVGRFDEK